MHPKSLSLITFFGFLMSPIVYLLVYSISRQKTCSAGLLDYEQHLYLWRYQKMLKNP